MNSEQFIYSDLTICQQNAFETYRLLWNSQTTNVMLLTGRAGTGKTTVINTIVHDAVTAKLKIAVTALTNAAVKEVRKKVTASSGVKFMTIHSLLAIREVFSSSGDLEFAPVYGEENKWREFDVIIIDEISMMVKSLLDIIKNNQAMYCRKVVLSGDKRQCLPVNEDEVSKAFEYFDYKAILKTVVRQKEGSIVKYSDDIANYNNFESSADGSIHIIRNKVTFDNLVVSLIDNRQDLLVCYKNDTVDFYNEIIREKLFGQNALFFIKGDYLVALATGVDDEGKILFHNNDYFEVMHVGLEELEINNDLKINYWNLTVIEDGTYKKLRVVEASSKKTHLTVLNGLRANAKTAVNAGMNKKEAWKPFIEFRDHFHQVKHAYAVTIHKAQGRTCDKVYIAKDASLAFGLSAKKLRYTAMTRARNKVIIHL